MKTIKQIADELGLEKDKVKYQVKKLPTEHVKKQGNVTYITPDGERLLLLALGKSPGEIPTGAGGLPADAEEIPPESPPVPRLSPAGDAAQGRIKELENEIEKLKIQLEYERAAAVEAQKWRELFEREQELRLIQLSKSLSTGDVVEATPADAVDMTEAKPQKKKGFFANLFGKMRG